MSLERFLAVDNLRKVYRSGSIEVEALRGVTFAVPAGAFLAVTGASGSGKSTLLNLLGGLDTPTSGTITVAGEVLQCADAAALARYRRCRVGMIFQSFHLLPSRTALENVELPMMLAEVGKAERRRRAAELLRTVGLAGRGTHRPGELSGGEQQRVAIARALANRPHLLLADEPTGNLDSRTASGVMDLLAELNRGQGLTILFVSHENDLVRRYASARLRLHDGALQGEDA